MSSQLVRARSLLAGAELAATAQARWRDCLQAARHAADLALAAGQGGPRPLEVGQLWASLAVEAPGLAEWASYFALLEGLPWSRELVSTGSTEIHVSERQAADLLRDVTLFCELVEARLRRAEARARHG